MNSPTQADFFIFVDFCDIQIRIVEVENKNTNLMTTPTASVT